MFILNIWHKLSHMPGGKKTCSFLLSRKVPYTGSIHPEIVTLSPGYAKVQMRDRRRVRNHLSSIHAAALMNLAEAASGLAFLTNLPANSRAILVGFSIEYLKKARGLLIAESLSPSVSQANTNNVYEVESVIRDAMGEAVARASAKWQVGMKS